ncbi:MAG TPA: dihydroxyacetone kinase [Syntrophomonas sp.]|nr:dihydroxyacetone kinase [Syntrophomonas sp.]
MSLLFIDGSDFVRAIKGGTVKLESHRDQVDQLNVFPVPDGDTGTNMFLTLQSAVKEGERTQDQPLGKVSKAVSIGSLMGARGNSGVILSQIFRGLAAYLDQKEKVDAKELAMAFKSGARTAYEAVMKPVEGTILTVIREISRGCEEEARKNNDVVKVVLAGIRTGYNTLEKTPLMLPVLREAGVVDAGGQGLLYFMEGFAEALAYDNEINLEGLRLGWKDAVEVKPAPEAVPLLDYRYCTELLLKGQELNLQQIKNNLSNLGDSLLVVGDEKLVKIHVHTNHPGRVLESCLQLGSLNDIKINNMQEEVHQHKNNWPVKNGAAEQTPADSQQVGLVAVGSGPGVVEILKSLGVNQVVEGGQTMNPSTEELLNACGKINASAVIILPNNSNVILAAQQAALLAENQDVRVVPTRSVMQCITGLIAFQPDGDLEDMVAAMEEEIKRVKYAEITKAVRDSAVNGLDIKDGDVIGIIGDSIEVKAEDNQQAVKAVLEQIVDENSELITLFYGADVDEDAARELMTELQSIYADYEIQVHYGGQPHYRYYISVE